MSKPDGREHRIIALWRRHEYLALFISLVLTFTYLAFSSASESSENVNLVFLLTCVMAGFAVWKSRRTVLVLGILGVPLAIVVIGWCVASWTTVATL